MSASTGRYTHGHHESVLRSHTWRTVENSAAYLIPHLRPGAKLLDVGCGPGTITADFATRLAPGMVVGLDASADVIAAAAAAAAPPNLDYIVGIGESLPFPDATFDIAHAHQTLQHVRDPVAVLREMMRVTVPGGIIAARDVDYAGTVWFPALPPLDRWMELYQSIARSNGGEPNAGRRLSSWARSAGLRDLQPTASVWCFATVEERSWWGEMWADRVMHSAFAADVLELSLAEPGELREISDAWRAWAAAPDAVLIMPHGKIVGRN